MAADERPLFNEEDLLRPGLLRGAGGGEPRDPGADDEDVQNVRFAPGRRGRGAGDAGKAPRSPRGPCRKKPREEVPPGGPKTATRAHASSAAAVGAAPWTSPRHSSHR